MRATLIYNPVSGRRSATRFETVEQVRRVLLDHGWAAEAVATVAAGSAAHPVREAVRGGATHIFACGGDGTVHDVLQEMVDEDMPAPDGPILGVIPMGSANALARHLGLSMSPVEAVRKLLSFVPCTVPVGRVECGGGHRYFLVMAGAGPDGMLVYRMLGSGKGRLGRFAYYARAARLFATRSFPAFALEYVESRSGERRRMHAVSAMAVRVGDLGGVFSRLGGRGDVRHPHLELTAVQPPGWISLPAWFAMGWLGVGRWNPLVRGVAAEEFRCSPLGEGRLHIQADGEWVGEGPMRVTTVPDAVRLLMPPVQG